MKILIGSTALRHHIPATREPKDVDWFTDEPVNKGEEPFWHPTLANWEWSGPVASLNELYTLKVSHSFWELRNRSWTKHMFDVTKMKDAGAELIPALYAILYPIWEERYGKKKINLELEPDVFFNPHVNRKFDHDSIHASVSYRSSGIPMFNEILRDGHKIAVDRNKWEALSTEDKNRLVREEVYATALERRVIPADYNIHPMSAYSYALKQTITSYTKGWFPLYIVENFGELRKPDVDYVSVHQANSDRLILL